MNVEDYQPQRRMTWTRRDTVMLILGIIGHAIVLGIVIHYARRW